MADELAVGVMAELRGVRGSKEEDPLSALKPSLEAASAKISASAWAGDPAIQKGLARQAELFAEYEKITAGGPVPQEPPPPAMGEEGAEPAPAPAKP